ncbi:hypothetical protein J6590_060810 [Homalodisca vitripennis]|nr:hypothetical protein J6590_060810 [Homalodisca vitripennis]
MNFTVDDGLHSTSGVVEVQTLSANRRAPYFDKTAYQAVLQENLPSGQIVVKVVATDTDVGAFGNISYSLPLQRSSEYFSIDRFSGDILTRKPLDREISSFHQLHVLATDGGGLIGWVSVEVNVLDENDNNPVFELPTYISCVSGDLTTNQTIVKVKAVDADAGLAGVVKYSIMDVEPRLTQDWFRIHPQEGVVTVTRPITLKEIQVVKMTVIATDSGSPPLQNDVILTVTLMPREQPTLQVHYIPSSFIIPPSAKPGHIIYHFKNTLKGNMKYHIIGGDNALGINSTGHLFIQRPSTFFRKKIGILMKSSNGIVTSCAFKEILIESQHGQLYVPTFFQDKVVLKIPENTAVGSLVYKVYTKDEIPVLFSMPNSSPWISIDPLTGWMSVTSPLDREAHEELEIVVIATHQHITSLSSGCSILIYLTDYNDNPHIFNQDVYNVAVKEDAALESVLVQLALTDPDKDRGTLTWDTGDPTFGVTANFELVLLWPLDREKTPSYVLNVTASDGVFTATTRVNVLVIDVNDERHRCLHPIYNVSILESQSPGYLVTTVLTSDPDLETNLIYRLSGLGSEKFSIDNHGEVRLRHFLDRETSSGYLLEATALDPTHPDWLCTSRIQMKIEDVNDNSPSFTINNETITMTEDAVVGMIVTKLQFLDFDEGENRQVHYTLVDSAGLFNVSSNTGILSLIRPLQSSPGSVHYVTAKVSDHGRPSLTSLTTLQVIVLGMNDDPPLLVSGAYHVSVSEDTPVFTSLLDIKAFSDDVERKFNVIYTILEGNGHGEFDVDKRTGALSTCKTLDFESRQVYQLLILATSVGDSSLTSYVSVNVTVLDANDNPPIFKITRYTLQIREDVEVGQMILKVDADDVDSGRNGLVLFSLDEISRRYFGIDSLSGVLMVGSHLDRENVARHDVLVLATDQGIPALSSTATVTIDVLDVNDNPPIFLHPNATAVLQADRLPGWAVFHFAVSDADQLDQSSFTPLSFHLTSGNEKEMFRVDPDGTLRTTDKLNVRLGDSFKLTIKVEDGGRLPVLHSSTWIYIKVVEPSKHPPSIVPLWVWVGVYEHQWQGGDLGLVAASDLDPYDKLEYSVSGTPLFTIDPRLGVLKARSNLAPGVYSVNVSVTDGKFSTSSLVSVTVELLLQDMLQSSIYIRLSPKMRQEILVARLPVFLSTLRSAFLRDVSLISIQDIQNSTIGVLIAVTGGADLAVVREVMVSTGLVGTTPQCDCMNGGVCQRQLQMMPERTNIFSAPGLTFVTPSHSLAYYCICSMGYAGEHCEEVKCQCPPLQVCVPQRVGFACMPPCSANQTCPASMTSSVTWSDVVTYLCTLVGIIVTICALVLYRKYKSSSGDRKYGSWGKHNCYIKKKTKLSNLEASQKPPIFTGSPNNGAISRNNLESTPGASMESETIPLDYLRNINPVTKMENDIIQGHSSAPDLATCHAADSFIPDDPARDLAELDDRLSQEVIEYGFPPPEAPRTLPEHTEISL